MSARITLAVCFCLLTACATTGGGRPATTVAKLASIQPSRPENAVLVLYRNTAFGSMFGPLAYKGSVFVDEVPVGDLSDDSYGTIELNAGRHSVRITGSAAGAPMQSATVVSADAGKVQFLELTTEQGFGAASVTLKRNPAPSLQEIADDCREAFQLDLSGAPAAAPKPAGPPVTSL